MGRVLDEALHRLADVNEAQLHELRRARVEREHERRDTPEFRAELQARREPLRHTAFVRRLAALRAPFEVRVPPEFWAHDDSVVIVSCPCGEMPGLTAAGAPLECDCGRWFVFSGQHVYVAFGPQQPRCRCGHDHRSPEGLHTDICMEHPCPCSGFDRADS